MNKRIPIYLLVLAIFGFLFSSSSSICVKASELAGNEIVVTPEDGSSNVIFGDKDGLWYPGKELTKGFYIANQSDQKIQLDKITFKSSLLEKDSKPIDENQNAYKEFFKNTDITLTYKDKYIYRGSYEGLLAEGLILEDPIVIASKDKELLHIGISINKAAPNDLQDIRNMLDFNLTYSSMDNMPQTGSNLNSTLLITISISLLVLAGGILIYNNKKGKKEECKDE